MTGIIYIDVTSLLGALAVSVKISTDGLHKRKEFGNHQSRAKVSNWWAGPGMQRCSFKCLSELPAFKNREISHFFKNPDFLLLLKYQKIWQR